MSEEEQGISLSRDHEPPITGGDGSLPVPSLRPALVPRALVDMQSHQRCSVCGHHKLYCQQVGHTFTPVVTCESCLHIGARYWGSDDYPVHFCGQSKERRAAVFKSTGNAADDFMQEFRRFYDAGPKQTNCGQFFEAKPLPNPEPTGQSSEHGQGPVSAQGNSGIPPQALPGAS
jgi:hypothetical protein